MYGSGFSPVSQHEHPRAARLAAEDGRQRRATSHRDLTRGVGIGQEPRGGPAAGDLSGFEDVDGVGVAGDEMVRVGDHDEGHAVLFAQARQQIHDAGGRVRVEEGGGDFVAQQDVGAGGEGAGPGDLAD
ncbi:hypothetical protein ACFTWD_00780 [Streptomyces sp. NPDC056943]|uniref:hypothetical protein n=1 Tax=Streptomyces sp. NPDC056943 TaxID=3345971 RepID=UPI00362E21B2